jgi:hypothetical protein
VAEAGIRALERGKLVTIPQLDGRWLWRVKRFLPGLFHSMLATRGQTIVESMAAVPR